LEFTEVIALAKEINDNDIKRKAVKLVVAHIRKKLPENFDKDDNLGEWLRDMDVLLEKDEFLINEYYDMRSELNYVVDRVLDDELRYKLRDSWYSFGKALEKKKKPK
jgi:hypothetical protein